MPEWGGLFSGHFQHQLVDGHDHSVSTSANLVETEQAAQRKTGPDGNILTRSFVSSFSMDT